MIRLNDGTAKQLIFLNKSAACERTGKKSIILTLHISSDRLNDRKYEGTSSDVRFINIQDLKRSKKGNILLVFIVDDYIAGKMHQKNITVVIFNDFIRNQILFQCILASESVFRFVLILDNIKIHGNEEFIQMCENANVILIRLFSYFFLFQFDGNVFFISEDMDSPTGKNDRCIHRKIGKIWAIFEKCSQRTRQHEEFRKFISFMWHGISYLFLSREDITDVNKGINKK